MADTSVITKFQIDNNIEDLICNNPNLEKSVKDQLLKREWITLNDLKYLLNSKHLSKEAISKVLQAMKFFLTKERSKPKTKEFINQMERLKNLELERQYQEMIIKDSIYDKTLQIHKEDRLGVDKDIDHEMLTPSRFAKHVKEQMTTVINIAFTCGSVAFAVWYWTKSSMIGLDISYRVFLSLMFGLLALIAEVVVYNGYHRRINEAKIKERKQKEKKKIIGTTIIKKGQIIEEKLQGDDQNEKQKKIRKHE